MAEANAVRGRRVRKNQNLLDAPAETRAEAEKQTPSQEAAPGKQPKFTKFKQVQTSLKDIRKKKR